MRKTDKKIDKQLREVLTEVCDYAQQYINGYQWISHSVNYKQFPGSLVITCMFNDKDTASSTLQAGELLHEITAALNRISITLPNPKKQIRFESQ